MYVLVILSLLLIVSIYYLYGKMIIKESFFKKKKKKKRKKRNKKKVVKDTDTRIVGIPSKYFSELKYELRDQWKANFNNIYEFKTTDDKYTCMFMNSENVKNIPFVRTIIPEENNHLFTLDTTYCPKNADPSICNNDDSMNIENKLFYEDVENVDYSVKRNKVFLQLDDGTSYDDLNKLSNNEVNMTYKTKYQICKPYSSGKGKNTNYDFNRGFDQLFPCGYLKCTNNSKISKNWWKKRFKNSVLKKQKQILKEEHQSKIDGILESLGFKTWIKTLKTFQERNDTISEFCKKPGDRNCDSGDRARENIERIMSSD